MQSVILTVSASTDDYIDFRDMGNYDHSVQKNIDKKMSEFGMVPDTPRPTKALSASAHHRDDNSGTCDTGCVRSLEYLQRIVKSLLRQMRVQSHNFGPGEAITIDLRAELKYDDYVTLTKFMNSKQESDKYLYRIDEIMSNFIHVVEHSSSRLDFLENIINFPGFYSLKFWIILITTTVIGSLIVMLLVKAFYTPAVHVQLIHGFLIIFILSCVWSFSSLYEGKKAEMHTSQVQSNGIPPKDCDYHNMGVWDSVTYFFRVNVLGREDHCTKYYATTMTDPFWKVNPMEAISTSVAFFVFTPMGYIGERMGSFYSNFIGSAPLLMKPVMLAIALLLTILFFYGPFRIRTPLLTIEPVWRPEVPALERHPVHQQLHAMIGAERVVRNEIMERPDGPVVKSVRDATTDMDDFQEYLTSAGTDDLEITSPFARFNLKEKNSECSNSTITKTSASSPSSSTKTFENADIKNVCCDKSTITVPPPATPFPKTESDAEFKDQCTFNKTLQCKVEDTAGEKTKYPAIVKKEIVELVECVSLPGPNIILVKQELLRDALREEPNISQNILP